MHYDVIVIGAGIAGWVAATFLAQAGRKVLLLAAGVGATHVSSGCVDVLGRVGEADVASPRAALSDWIAQRPAHPYALIGPARLEQALAYFQEQCLRAGWRYVGGLDDNWRLPTALGTVRPTCLAPESMIAGDARQPGGMLLVGFRPLRDFYPQYAAANLAARGLAARGVYLDVPALRGRDQIAATELARVLDEPGPRQQVLRVLKAAADGAERVGMPAVLGLRDQQLWRELSDALGRPLFEIPTLPPSVPGVRLYEAWRALFREAGGRAQIGFPVAGAETEDRRVRAVFVASSVRTVRYEARHFVLATGGLYGHGLLTDAAGDVVESIFHLPLRDVPARAEWLASQPSRPHPIYATGVPVDPELRPIDERGQVVFENLYAAGAILAGGDGPRAGVGDGVAIGSAYAAAAAILAADRSLHR